MANRSGSRIRMNRVYDSPYDVRLTDLNNPIIPRRGDAASGGDGFQNRNVTFTMRVTLVGGNPGVRVLPDNPRRVGLVIQNLDAVADLNWSFGNSQDAAGMILVPRSSFLFDFTTPRDGLYLFSAANITVSVMDITRGF